MKGQLHNDAFTFHVLFLCAETNKYAEQQRAAHPPPAFAPRWTPVCIEEMKAFTGLCFSMGLLRLPSRHDYWRKKKWLFVTNFSEVMSRDRFDLIWRYLHLQDGDEQPPQRDPLWKMRWYLNHMRDNFAATYTPDKEVTVDESMVKFKGRLSFRQYLPSKPIKWGIKVWALCEAATGYLSNFQVYTGREEGRQEQGLSYRVVMDLMQPYLGLHYLVYMDNFYTSPALFCDLRLRGTYACGTVRCNRKGLPQELRKVTQERHAFKVAQKDELSFCVWQDTKSVMVLSNCHSPTATGVVRRRVHNQRQDVEVPAMLADYQRGMRGVDLFDQMIGYYLFHHRSKKWWRRLFFYLQTAVNAYVVAKASHPAVAGNLWPSLHEFVEDLALGLIGEWRNKRAPPLAEVPVRPIGQHTIMLMQGVLTGSE